MENSYLDFLDKDDPRLKLTIENRIKNIFVTQLEETRHEQHANHIPVIREAPSKILETGVNTLQRTLVVRKQVEVDEVDRQLALTRQEFRGHMQALEQKRAGLELQQQETKEKAKKFEKFVNDNEVKRHRALKNYQLARRQNVLKHKELEDLTEQLEKLKQRKQDLKERVVKYKMYEDYLTKILDLLPENYLEHGSDSVITPIMRRHETLSITQQDLMQRVGQLTEELEQGQRHLAILKEGHNTNKLMSNKELSELQGQLDRLRERNNQLEMNLLMDQCHSRDQIEEVATMLMAMRNLGEQCYLKSYGPLEEMNTLTMMDMIKEYILEKTDTEKKATRLMETGSVWTSAADLSEKREKGSLKNTGSKTKLTSSSKASGRSGISN